MKSNAIIIVAIGVVFLMFLSGNASGAGIAEFSGLVDIYGADKISRLQALYNAMQGKGLTGLQIKMMLSQAMHETGLLTTNPDLANYNLMDNQNNFAGIRVNSRYPQDPGNGYADYPDLDAFVNDWITILTFNNEPINAYSITDFNTRLKANGYYTDNSQTYGNDLNQYFNLLSQYIN